ncbi:MBL fold metallo-hydrolase [Sporosarcina soli]|uniref:MBL fold metallo-hydrolase n=1 Tax=Sporosarcina soli TaxID=334736 RepID=A0ABW0TLD0_9BACL
MFNKISMDWRMILMTTNIKKQASKFKVTLLGTGCPVVSLDRFGNTTLVEIGEKKLVFDVGRGAVLRLSQLDIFPGEIDEVFLTHLHSDHLVGFPDLWLSGVIPTLGKRAKLLKLRGPEGTKQMASHLEKAFSKDINARIAHGTIHPRGAQIEAYDYEEGLIYDEEGIKITAFLVDHGTIKPCYGFRIDYEGHSILISGDTKYNENLIRHSRNVDLLIHEVAAASLDAANPETIRHIMDIHTTPEQAGEIFKRVKPKLAVYTHIVLLGGITEEEADLIGRTKEIYSGDVLVGEDLMSFEIGDEIKVNYPKKVVSMTI